VPAAARGATRPGTRRPGTSARPRAETPPERPASTAWVRGAILVSIVVMLAVTLVPTLRSLVRQQSEIGAIQAKVVQQGQHVEALQKEQAQWTDPAFVEQQARERLKFVRVGDRSYTVVDPAEPARGAPSAAVAPAPRANASGPWYGQLWQSVKIADRPGAGAGPAPVPVPAQ